MTNHFPELDFFSEEKKEKIKKELLEEMFSIPITKTKKIITELVMEEKWGFLLKTLLERIRNKKKEHKLKVISRRNKSKRDTESRNEIRKVRQRNQNGQNDNSG